MASNFDIELDKPLEDSHTIGQGAYGAVYKAYFKETECIAKRLHDILTGSRSQQYVSHQQWEHLVVKFRQECSLLSQMRHPNVVQFLGIYQPPGSDPRDIALIMEKLHIDLKHFIEEYKDVLTPLNGVDTFLSLKLHILRDICCGLLYIHSHSVVHRDLNAGNVLLTESLKAKVADLGMARIIDQSVATGSLTQGPGAPDYMPPEAFDENPTYNSKLDSFSLGHLMLYLLTCVYPKPVDPSLDSISSLHQSGQHSSLQALKRQKGLDSLGVGHILYNLIVSCLHDKPDPRPTMEDIKSQLERHCTQHPKTMDMVSLVFSKRRVSYQHVLESKMQDWSQVNELQEAHQTENYTVSQDVAKLTSLDTGCIISGPGPEDMSIFKSVLAKMLWGHSNPTHIKICVVGETGEGKSTLINSIVEREVAETKPSVTACTTEVKEYKQSNITPAGISVSLFDSPGLNDSAGDDDKYIRALEETCQEVDLVLFCKKLGDRWKNGEKAAMLKLTDRFGEKFWSYVVFVHTFANIVDVRKLLKQYPGLDELQSFKHFLTEERNKIKNLIQEVIQVDRSIVDEIPFIPAGEYYTVDPSGLQLPDRANWLQSMLEECCHQIKDKHKFKKLNLSHRFHLAIIINNDIKSSKPADSGQSQSGGTQSNSDQVRCTLEALGYHVLYFDSLTSDNIKILLDAFSTADHTDLAAFGLIVFSKGMSSRIYDVDNEVVPFKTIFKHFSQSADIPKFFFFHLNGTSREDIQLPDPPSKSIALAMSVDSPQSDISLAVRSFASEMKKDVEPIVDVFRKIAAQCGQSGNCKSKYTFHEKFILPVCYEAANDENLAHQGRKKLRFCCSMWYRVRHNTIDSILQNKDELLDAVKKANEAQAKAASTSLAVVGGLTVAGLALTPLTLGASILLALAGVGATSAATKTVAYIYVLIESEKQLQSAQKHIKFDQQFTRKINTIVQSYKSKLAGGTLSGASTAPTDIANIIAEISRSSEDNNNDSISQFLIKISEALLIRLFYFTKKDVQIIGDMISKDVSNGAAQYDMSTLAAQNLKLKEDGSTLKEGQGNKVGQGNSTLKEGQGNSISTLTEKFWSEDGWSLHVLSGGLSPHVLSRILKNCQVSVGTIFSGPFKIPAEATLVSAIYDVTISEPKLPKLLFDPAQRCNKTITVQHCVDVTDSSISRHMCFAFAECDLKNKIFEFKKLVRGRIGKERGTIEVKKSCCLCILYFERDIDVVPIKYVAISCDKRKSKDIWKRTIVLTKDLPTHIQYAKKKQLLKDESAVIPFKFKPATSPDSPQIILENFSERIDKNGWSIFRDKVPNKISKREIDTVEFQDFPKLPVIKLNVAAFDERAQRELKYKIPLVGTVSPDGTDVDILFEFSY